MENAHGVKSWKLYDTENALVVHLRLEAGESLKPHITLVESDKPLRVLVNKIPKPVDSTKLL